MIHYLFCLLLFFIAWNCTENTKTSADSPDSSITTKANAPDTIDPNLRQPKENIFEKEPISRNTKHPDTSKSIRIGKHNFTLHWISWDHPGYVTMEPLDSGWYKIKGQQEDRDSKDYININGYIKPLTDKELLFKGTIQYRVETINKGELCIKKGEQIFLSTKGRKYWRMQNMLSCEGGTTDYIDIYF